MRAVVTHPVKLSDLVVFAVLTLVLVVALPADHVVGGLPSALGDRRVEARSPSLGHRAVVGSRVTVREVLRSSSVVGLSGIGQTGQFLHLSCKLSSPVLTSVRTAPLL